jgi:uncharacterized protein
MSRPCPRLDALPGRLLAGGLRVATAEGVVARTLGLAGLEAMPPERALHIPRCRSVHTLGMRFPLDLLWLDAAGAVVRVDRGVPPNRLRACRRARSVLEVDAGAADAFAAALHVD